MNVYSQNPTAAEEVALYDLESLRVVPVKSQGLYVSQGKCIMALYSPMPRPAQLISNDFTRRCLANRL